MQRKSHGVFFWALLGQCSVLALHIFDPPRGSVIPLGEDGSITLRYKVQAASSIKTDVFGSADPGGWAGVRMGSIQRTESGLFVGDLTLLDLELGAVRIRLRALTADGRDAVGEDTVEYFLGPDTYFQNIFASSAWMQSAVVREVENCCLDDSSEAACTALEMAGAFCDAAIAAIDKNHGVNAEQCEGGQCQGPRNETPNLEENTGVLALMYGYDSERLFPFVESLRSTGYAGMIHLVHANPEIECEESAASCVRMRRYLAARGVTVEPFPSDIQWARQHLHFHETLTRLQIWGSFASGVGARLDRVLITESKGVLFQQHPFAHLPLDATTTPELLVPTSSLFPSGGEQCWAQATGGERGRWASGEVLAGTPRGVHAFVAEQLILAWKLVAARGIPCTALAPADLSTWILASQTERDGGRRQELVDGGGYVARLVDGHGLCAAGRQAGERCGEEGIARQACLNRGCCFWGGAYQSDREQGGRPGCFAPLSLPPHRIPYSIQNNQVVARAATRNGAADEGRAVVVVWNYDSDRGVAQRVWEQHAAALARFFPRKKEDEASAEEEEASEEEEEEEEKRNGERKREFPRRVQARADAALRGRWTEPFEDESVWEREGGGGRWRGEEELRECLDGVEVHMFGDSRMRALSFSLMKMLQSSVDDRDSNLKELVVPLEHADLCGGNRRYQNHVACASKMGYAVQAGNATTVAFHELFHFDHGPTLAAMLESMIDAARQQGRRVLMVLAPGFHFVSQAPFDASSMMAAFLPQIGDAIAHADWRYHLPLWLTMEPTSGGKGAWPELEKVNEVAERYFRLSGAGVVVDTYSLALPRPDLLTDGSHYSYHYRRVAAQVLLSIVCPD